MQITLKRSNYYLISQKVCSFKKKLKLKPTDEVISCLSAIKQYKI